jgi:hypothetical protein
MPEIFNPIFHTTSFPVQDNQCIDLFDIFLARRAAARRWNRDKTTVFWQASLV